MFNSNGSSSDQAWAMVIEQLWFTLDMRPTARSGTTKLPLCVRLHVWTQGREQLAGLLSVALGTSNDKLDCFLRRYS